MRQFLQLQANCGALVDREISGCRCKRAIEPDTAVIDGKILELIEALGLGQRLQL
jgi:hypothetical protein